MRIPLLTAPSAAGLVSGNPSPLVSVCPETGAAVITPRGRERPPEQYSVELKPIRQYRLGNAGGAIPATSAVCHVHGTRGWRV